MGRRYGFSASLAVATVLCLALIHGAAAQDPGRDYYQARTEADGVQLLRNLDQNHYRRAVGALEERGDGAERRHFDGGRRASGGAGVGAPGQDQTTPADSDC